MIKLSSAEDKKKRIIEFKLEVPVDDFSDALASFSSLERRVIEDSLNPLTVHNSIAALALIVERIEELQVLATKE